MSAKGSGELTQNADHSQSNFGNQKKLGALKVTKNFEKCKSPIQLRYQNNSHDFDVADDFRKNRVFQHLVPDDKIKKSERNKSLVSQNKQFNLSIIGQEETVNQIREEEATQSQIRQVTLPMISARSNDRQMIKRGLQDQVRDRKNNVDGEVSRERSSIKAFKYNYDTPVKLEKASLSTFSSGRKSNATTTDRSMKSGTKRSPIPSQLNILTDNLSAQMQSDSLVINTLSPLGTIHEEEKFAEKIVQNARMLSRYELKNEFGRSIHKRLQQGRQEAAAAGVKNYRNRNCIMNNFQIASIQPGEIIKVTMQYEQNQTIIKFQSEQDPNYKQNN